MGPIRFDCACHEPASKWLEEPPISMHAYRVQCGRCHKFVKWGTQSELDERLKLSQNLTVIAYELPPPKATLDKFFDDK